MRAPFLAQGNRSERTFAVALSLLGAIAAAQVVAGLLLHSRPDRGTTAAATAAPRAVVLEEPAQVAKSSAPAAQLRTAVAPVPTRILPRSKTPARARPPAAPRSSVPEELLQVAKALRLHGDTGNAIAKLQQATALAPDNAEILAELAMTYESMQLFDRSNETWRKLKDLGLEADALGELADLKLKMGVPVQGIPGSTGRSPTEPASPDSTGIPEGSAFGISQVTPTTVADPEAVTKLALRVGVKKRPNLPVDYTKVKIQVFFYDVVNNDQVLLTDADVSYEWITPGHNWSDTDTEVLDVTYLRAKKYYPAPGAASAAVPDSVEKATRAEAGKGGGTEDDSDNAPRQYLGYIVRVYYQNELQAVRADPTRLLNLFPPPFTAPPQ